MNVCESECVGECVRECVACTQVLHVHGSVSGCVW